MDSYFSGKNVLVTGAGKGLGRAVSIKLYELGAKVTAISRTQEDLDSLKSECPTMKTVSLDISNWDVSRAAVEAIGHVDMLVNNAGILDGKVSFLDVKKEDFRMIQETNFFAAFNVAQISRFGWFKLRFYAVASEMVKQKTGGAIVNVSSIAARFPILSICYCASKAAMDMLTMIMAKELGQYKILTNRVELLDHVPLHSFCLSPCLSRPQIRTNSVNPGFFLTNMTEEYLSKPEHLESEVSKTPMGEIAKTRDIVDTVLYLLSDKASMVNGQKIIIDGGAYMP